MCKEVNIQIRRKIVSILQTNLAKVEPDLEEFVWLNFIHVFPFVRELEEAHCRLELFAAIFDLRKCLCCVEQ